MTRSTPIPETVTLHIAYRVVKRGGRKEMQLPEGAVQPRRADSTLVKALARAFRWKSMLESGEFASIAELAEREGIAPSYMTRVLRVTLLAPCIVEAILNGRQDPAVTLARLMEGVPADWCDQHHRFGSQPPGRWKDGAKGAPGIDSLNAGREHSGLLTLATPQMPLASQSAWQRDRNGLRTDE